MPTEAGLELESALDRTQYFFRFYYHDPESHKKQYSPSFMAFKRVNEEGEEYFRGRIEDVVFTFQHTGDLESLPPIPIYSILEIEASDKYRTLQDCLDDCYEFDLNMARFPDENSVTVYIDDIKEHSGVEIDEELVASITRTRKLYEIDLYYRTSVGFITLREASLQDLTDRLIYFYHNAEIWPSPLEV